MTELYYAEDDPNIAGMVKAYLERKNIKVSIYGTLAEVKLALSRRLPAMVLLDWNMPDGRGDGLCQWIRGSWKELPIIFLTVRGDSADIVSGFESGADDYVVKPFALEVLYSRVQAVLRRSGNVSGQYLSCGGITPALSMRSNSNFSTGSSQVTEIKSTSRDEQKCLMSSIKSRSASLYACM